MDQTIAFKIYYDKLFPDYFFHSKTFFLGSLFPYHYLYAESYSGYPVVDFQLEPFITFVNIKFTLYYLYITIEIEIAIQFNFEISYILYGISYTDFGNENGNMCGNEFSCGVTI